MGAWKRASAVMVLAAAGFGAALSGCGSRTDGAGGSSATLNLTSLPSAEVWVDGSARGSTPVVVAVASGRHELVMRQTGFEDFRQTLDVQGSAPQTVDATLLAKDAESPDALRKIAAAFDVTVEPITAPSLHRGGAGGDVVLMFPRNDVRREGLTTWRIDVTPGYAGDGTLEWREGKNVLAKQAFNPTTLVSVGDVPKSVLDASKVGLTVTWGIYFPDRRKAVTAQFEVVSKPQAAKKLAELDADKRLAKQPVELRDQLKAEVLQNYRLYSEALATYLDLKTKNKDSVLPHGGIVSCLRRMDLESTALYAESASKVSGKLRRGETDGGISSATRPGLAQTQPGATTPPAAPAAQPPAPASGPSAPAAPPAPEAPPAPDAQPIPVTPPMPVAPPAPDAPKGPDAAPVPMTPATPPAPPGEAGMPPVAPPNSTDAAKAPARVADDSRVAAGVAADAAKAAAAARDQAQRQQQDLRAAADAALKAAADHAGQGDAPALAKAAHDADMAAKQAARAAADAASEAAKAAVTARQQAIQALKDTRTAADAAAKAAADRAGLSDASSLAKAAHDAEQAAKLAARTAADATTEASKAAATAKERTQQVLTDTRAAADAAAKAAADHAGQPDAPTFAKAAHDTAEALKRAERAAAEASRAADEAAKSTVPPSDAK